MRPYKRSFVEDRTAAAGALEWNVVVGDALMEILGRRRGGYGWRTLCGTRHRYGPLVIAGALRGSIAATTAATQQHQVLSVADHLCEVLLLPFLVLVAASFEAAFHVDSRTFQQVTGDVVRFPHGDVVPVRELFPFARLLVFSVSIGRQGELGNRNSGGGEFGLGVFAKTPDQNDFVDAFRCHLILNCITPTAWRPYQAIALKLDIPDRK